MGLRDVPKRTYLFLIVNLALIVGGVWLFAELADDVAEEEKFMIDQKAQQFLEHISSPTADRIFAFVTDLGSVNFITVSSILLVILIFFIYKRRKWRIFYFSVAMIGIALITQVLKNVFGRERPNIFEEYNGTGFSFPSGHSTAPMVFYGFLIYLMIRSQMNIAIKWVMGIFLALLIFAIGFSRIYLGVHFATDVFAGHLLGLVWLISCILILEYTLWRKKR
ncbi:phosphatase PAP2 family protein [Piscibacillus halophilus]|uniref:Undecaprenyl-diphosphatase n=1 Tax=Piscibacillus halophilus TaxID=571933 RepID=A0A1H9J2T5_9BACI|nr:phosphatase PAP2 family protein [Piscibacillus halophilus]SEQ81164.1 undecaprenyl-diphosphatase [Piscibacillus halophilus]